MELQRRKELTEQMFHGMARIVDRFVVCDLENDHYEYHERREKELYPTEGSYLDLDRFKPVNESSDDWHQLWLCPLPGRRRGYRQDHPSG